ncbi:CE1759 family FMN reductase [Zhihengliuella sp.]|uniref:CE1759 family FMN reductase n=1 Tax=Zhihengliuella sp. TaxID=1954483 RepID=UPI002811932D|nr:CE1759 family FMN reductase [Zhihengliuella sp.]
MASSGRTRRIVVISGGLGVPSTSRMLGDRIAEAAASELSARGVDARVDVIELRDYATDVATAMVSRYNSPRVQQVIDLVTDADAMIAVSPVFTASVSGLLKSFIDLLDPRAFEAMPVVLAATGGSVRHSLVVDYAMRPIFSYLRADIMPTGVFAAPEDWGAADQGGYAGGALTARARRAGRELALALAVDAEDLSADLTTRSIAPTTAELEREPQDRRERRTAREREAMTTLPFEDLLASVNGNQM